jgi:hypothetical protein
VGADWAAVAAAVLADVGTAWAAVAAAGRAGLAAAVCTDISLYWRWSRPFCLVASVTVCVRLHNAPELGRARPSLRGTPSGRCWCRPGGGGGRGGGNCPLPALLNLAFFRCGDGPHRCDSIKAQWGYAIGSIYGGPCGMRCICGGGRGGGAFDSPQGVRAAEAAPPQNTPPHFGPADVFVGIACGWSRHIQSLEANGFG